MSASWTPVLRDAVRCKTEGGTPWAGRPARDARIALQHLWRPEPPTTRRTTEMRSRCRPTGRIRGHPSSGRALFSRVPRAKSRWFLLLGWQGVLGLRLGPRPWPDHVLGWRIAETSPEAVRLELRSALMTAHLILRVASSTAVLATNALRDAGTTNLLAAAREVGARRFVAESMTLGYGYGDWGEQVIDSRRSVRTCWKLFPTRTARGRVPLIGAADLGGDPSGLDRGDSAALWILLWASISRPYPGDAAPPKPSSA